MSVISQLVRQELIQNNNNFQKVINDVADGFKQCGFFNNPTWKAMLIEGFERGITLEDIDSYKPALSDPPNDESMISFKKGLRVQSTPLVVATGKDGRGHKRTRDENHDDDDDNNLLIPMRVATPSQPRKPAKQKKTITASSSNRNINQLLNDLKDENGTETCSKSNVVMFQRCKQLQLLNGLKDENGTEICSKSNVGVLERSKQSKGNKSASMVKNSTELPSRMSKRRNVVQEPPSESSVRRQIPIQVEPPISKQAEPPVVSEVSKTNGPIQEQSLDKDKQPLLNIANRRTTRKQTQLLAAYSGNAIYTPITERKNTFGIVQRTTIIFTMVEPMPYKNLFQKFNIYVADINDSYEYLVTEKIHRSAKFLSAVVSGKPIVSLDWLKALDKSEKWLDPLLFLLKDDEGEKQYNFSLSETLKISMRADRKLFHNFSILITPNTSPSPDALKDVVFSGGGKYLKTSLVPRKGDQVLCVSVEKDKKMWQRLRNKYSNLTDIVGVETFSNMIFRYDTTIEQTEFK